MVCQGSSVMRSEATKTAVRRGPRRLEDGAVPADAAGDDDVVGVPLEQEHRAPEAVGVGRRPVGEEEVERAEGRTLPTRARDGAECAVGVGARGASRDPGLVEAREHPGEEELAVGLAGDLREALGRGVRPEPRDVLHRAVVREDPATAHEGVRVVERGVADRLLADVRHEQLAAAADGEAVEPLVFASAHDARSTRHVPAHASKTAMPHPSRCSRERAASDRGASRRTILNSVGSLAAMPRSRHIVSIEA